jgi:2-dehydro-3-deoxygluconokinase
MTKKVVTFGEVMMRLSSPGYSKFPQANMLELAYGGGEANVSISLAYFGYNCIHVTRFPDNLLGKSATQYLRHHWIDTSEIAYGDEKIGLYFMEKGAVHRSSEVVYDRSNSAFANLTPDIFDWESILKDADWFHFTGITPGISECAAKACLDAIEVANESNVTVSFDVHSRKNLWNYPVDQRDLLLRMIARCDVVISSQHEIVNTLGIGSREDTFEQAAEQLTDRCDRLKMVVDKKRETLSASHNRIQGFLWSHGRVFSSPTFDVTHIVDRVGTGDAFAAGLIYGLLSYKNTQSAIDFAAAACALKHTVEGDANVVSDKEVVALMEGNNLGEIKR